MRLFRPVKASRIVIIHVVGLGGEGNSNGVDKVDWRGCYWVDSKVFGGNTRIYLVDG